MNNMELEIVSEFIYLGTMFQRIGSLKKNKINLAEKASKAMYDIRMVNNFTSICKSFSKSSEMFLAPCAFLLVKKVSKSFRYSANRNENKWEIIGILHQCNFKQK
jgi:predicted hydrolase (HD superfamily)